MPKTKTLPAAVAKYEHNRRELALAEAARRLRLRAAELDALGINSWAAIACESQAELIEARKFLAVGPTGWGQGTSIDGAKRAARRQGHQHRIRLAIYRLPIGAHRINFNDFGGCSWHMRDRFKTQRGQSSGLTHVMGPDRR